MDADEASMESLWQQSQQQQQQQSEHALTTATPTPSLQFNLKHAQTTDLDRLLIGIVAQVFLKITSRDLDPVILAFEALLADRLAVNAVDAEVCLKYVAISIWIVHHNIATSTHVRKGSLLWAN